MKNFIDTRDMGNFVRKAMKAPLLEKDYERKLTKDWLVKKNEKSLHELTIAHMRLVISYAMKYKSYGLNSSDLIQEGSIGLMKAANKFDLNQDVRFSTYASWWIRAAIQDFILKNWSLVRLGTSTKQKSLFFSLRKIKQKIRGTENGNVDFKTAHTLATDLQVSTSDVIDMDNKISQHDGSLNHKLSEDGHNEFLELVEDEDARPDDAAFIKDDRSFKKTVISEALKILNDREVKIIKERYLSETNKTLEILGNQLNISKERVRQIEKEAMIKMQIYISKNQDKQFLF